MPDASAAELQRQLKQRDAQVELLSQQVAQLTQSMQAMQSELRSAKSAAAATPGSSRKPLLGAGRDALAGSPGPGPSGASTARRPPQSPRQPSPGPGRPKTPAATARSASPSPRGGLTPRGIASSPKLSLSRAPPRPGSGSFHASMRGGPLTEPMPQVQLSQREREDPYNSIKGPSLLERKKFGAKKTAWEGFKSDGVNLLTDDNPFNDPIKYWPFKGWAFPPSDYIGPDDPRETDDLSKTADGNSALQLNFVFGYCGRRVRQNLFYNADSRLVYHTAALGVVYDKERHAQLFFKGHDDDITALDMHPDKVRVVTGQMGKEPRICVWSSRPDANGVLAQLCVIQGDHKRAIIGLSFSSTGHYIASMGKDNNRSIALYRWSTNPAKKAADMRIGMDKGHNDDVFCVDFNPVTDHVVAVGKKYIRFFGVKEGVEEAPSESRDAKLSAHESKLWAKKGVFGKKGTLQDIMCVAFGNDGITYAGTADGHIYRFAEQTMDMAVKAHGEGKELCKVTALWCNPQSGLLVSSGDDGLLHLWQPASWSPRAAPAPAPLRTIDMGKWVSPDLKGPPIKLDAGDKDDDRRKMGSPAAAHSLCGDERGKVLVGTVCNEIYEVDFNSDEPPMCYMQSHYDELWGLAAHPVKQSFVTASEDNTLRVWDLATRTMTAMAKLLGPGRSCAYSPDGRYVAVGLGGGGRAKGKPSPHDGKWLVLDAEKLTQVATPPQIRSQRISDIKWSPDGRLVAVASADNFIDIYSVDGSRFEHRYECKGHSSYITHVDWSADSQHMQSVCGAYELLYWNMYKEGEDGAPPRFRPHQEKNSSSMKDVAWATNSCIFGWPVRGVWPEDSDGTDVNACARSHAAKDGNSGLLATADDLGKVKLFLWPCIVPRAQHRAYVGHSAHVTNVAFTEQDKWLISTGGNDRAVFQWQVTKA